MSQFKAIFFDFYGVITADPFKIFLNIASRKSPEVHASVKKVIEEYFFGIRDAEYLASTLRIQLEDPSIIAGLFDVNLGHIDQKFYEVARDLSQKSIKIGIVGNLGRKASQTIQYMNQKYPILDVAASPIDTGTSVASPEVFAHGLKGVKEQPEACLYVSGDQENLEFARSIGMQVTNFVGFEALLRELEEKIR